MLTLGTNIGCGIVIDRILNGGYGSAGGEIGYMTFTRVESNALAVGKGDKTAKKVVKNYIEDLDDGIINIVNLFCSQVIILDGKISNERGGY